MKTLVIGHSVGIGKAIKDRLKSDGIGISTGFDISKFHPNFDYSNYNTIVLNAYANFCDQLKTIYDIVENKTFSKDKLLIVIASTSAYKTNPSNLYWSQYYTEKAAIIQTCRDLNTMGYNTSVISPGTVDTHRNDHKDIPKISPDIIADVVENITLNYFFNDIIIEHLVIRKRKN